jgi:hypothetical protein
MKKLNLCLFTFYLVSFSVTVPVLSEATQRNSSLTTLSQRGESLRGIEELLWFDFSGQQRWLAKRPPSGPRKGSVVLFAGEQAGPNGLHHLAQLRTDLPRYGWETFFFNLDDTADPTEQVLAALGQLSEQAPFVLVCEGLTCEALRNLQVDAAGAWIFLNLPLAQTSRITVEYRNSWQPAAQPTLILQEFPQGWPGELALLGGYELHLLPASTGPNLDVTVQRKIRGWFKRKLGGV